MDLTPETDAAVLASRFARAAPDERNALIPAVDGLFAAHQDLVYAACLRFVGRPELAAELAQDTLMRAWEKFGSYRGEARFSSWLLAIARYECLNGRRKRGELLVEDGVVDPADPARSALAALRCEERDVLVREAAATLDPVEQEAVQLRYVEHLPLETITALLALREASGARAVLQRCKRKLERELGRRLSALGEGSSFVRASVSG